LFNADVQQISAICRPVAVTETAATRIAEDVKPLQRSFCSFFFRAERKRRSFPFCAGKDNPSVAPRQLSRCGAENIGAPPREKKRTRGKIQNFSLSV